MVNIRYSDVRVKKIMARTEDLPSSPAWISLRKFMKDVTSPETPRALRDGLAEAYCAQAERAVGDYGKLLRAVIPYYFANDIYDPPKPKETVHNLLLRPVMRGNAVIDMMIHPDMLEDFLSTYSPVRGAENQQTHPESTALVETWQKTCRTHPRYRDLTHAPFSERLLAAGTTTGNDLPSDQWITNIHRMVRRARRIVQRLSPRDYALSSEHQDAETGQIIPAIHPLLVRLLGYEPVFINFEGHDKVPPAFQQPHRDLLPPRSSERGNGQITEEDPTPADSSSLAQTPAEFHQVLARETFLKKIFQNSEPRQRAHDWKKFIKQEQHIVNQSRERD
jgi:hypothetical protein